MLSWILSGVTRSSSRRDDRGGLQDAGCQIASVGVVSFSPEWASSPWLRRSARSLRASGVLIAARVLQGFGAAALTPASLALILGAFPKSRVPQAIAALGSGGSTSRRAGSGPLVGSSSKPGVGARCSSSTFRSASPSRSSDGGCWTSRASRRVRGCPTPSGRSSSQSRSFSSHLRSSSPARVGGLRYLDRRTGGKGSAWRYRSARRNRSTVRYQTEPVLAGTRPLLQARLPLGEPRSASLRHGVHDHVFWERPVSPRGLGLLAGLDHAGGVLGHSSAFLLCPFLRLGRLAGRIGQRPILIPGGVISAAAALFLLSRVDSAPSYLAVWLPFTLVSGVGVSMVLPLLTSAAVASLPSDPFATGSAAQERRAPQPRTDARRRHRPVARGRDERRFTLRSSFSHHQIAWWLVAAAGVAVSATSWRLPRVVRQRARSSVEVVWPCPERRHRAPQRSSRENLQ